MSKVNESLKLNIEDVMKRYPIFQMQSYFTGEMFETWYRKDKLLFIESAFSENGKVSDRFRILPSMNDASKTGHIDFTKHYYDDFEEAVKSMININVI